MINSDIKQGDIFWADLNPTIGHEQSGYRPVLIIQNDFLNKNLNTAIVAPITSNMAAKGLMTTFFIKKRLSLKDSVALLYQIRTLDRLRLVKRIACLSELEINSVKEQIAMIF